MSKMMTIVKHIRFFIHQIKTFRIINTKSHILCSFNPRHFMTISLSLFYNIRQVKL